MTEGIGAAGAGNGMDQAAAASTLRGALDGVTGRMGDNQHLVRFQRQSARLEVPSRAGA